MGEPEEERVEAAAASSAARGLPAEPSAPVPLWRRVAMSAAHDDAEPEADPLTQAELDQRLADMSSEGEPDDEPEGSRHRTTFVDAIRQAERLTLELETLQPFAFSETHTSPMIPEEVFQAWCKVSRMWAEKSRLRPLWNPSGAP